MKTVELAEDIGEAVVLATGVAGLEARGCAEILVGLDMTPLDPTVLIEMDLVVLESTVGMLTLRASVRLVVSGGMRAVDGAGVTSDAALALEELESVGGTASSKEAAPAAQVKVLRTKEGAYALETEHRRDWKPTSANERGEQSRACESSTMIRQIRPPKAVCCDIHNKQVHGR